MRTQLQVIFLLFFTLKFSCQTVPEEYHLHIKKADALLKEKNYQKAAFSYSDAFKTMGGKGYPEDRFQAAVAWAMASYPDSAIFNLSRIIYRVGFSDITRVNNERSFRSLHSHPHWDKLYAKLKANNDSVFAIELKLNKALISKLDSLTKEDQKWRQLSRRFQNGLIPKDSVSEQFIYANFKRTDSMNTFEARKIFYKYGFPNFEIAGNEGSNNFWLLIQHQDRYPSFQDSVLTAMKIEAENGKASWINYAYLLDRVKVNTGKEQVYGTQMWLNKDKTSYEPRPVIEREKLNERRKAVGLNTIEEYIETMNKFYSGSLNKK